MGTTDQDAELYYFHARWYDTGSAFFLSRDPSPASPKSQGALFCHGDPANKIDPDGRKVIRCSRPVGPGNCFRHDAICLGEANQNDHCWEFAPIDNSCCSGSASGSQGCQCLGNHLWGPGVIRHPGDDGSDPIFDEETGELREGWSCSEDMNEDSVYDEACIDAEFQRFQQAAHNGDLTWNVFCYNCQQIVAETLKKCRVKQVQPLPGYPPPPCP